jgi:hypothetical protein
MRFAGVVLVLAGLGGVAGAAGPTFWTIATSAEFLRGTSEGVYVSLEGVVTAGPQLENRLSTAPSQIWSLAQAPDGVLWAGTGGDGRVLRVRPGQKEETVFDADETNVFAIAVAGTRTYAATSPDGRVYVIEGGAAKPFFDPEEKYIWALSVDPTGRVWVGTGNPAVLYRVEPGGASKAIYKPPAAHVVSLTPDGKGRMLAGTESPGRLYRFEPDDRPFVLLESGVTEVRAATVSGDGTVFAAAVARGDESAPAGGETTSVAVSVPPPPATGTTPPPSTPTNRKSLVFRIDPGGSWEPIWETSDIAYDVAATDDGGVLVATGPEGRLYKVLRTRDVLLLTGVDAKQITRFAGPVRTGGRPAAFSTANPGRVVAVGAEDQSPATYVSTVRDSKSVATWGLIRWEGVGNVALYSRSGNTDKPDDSWSDWAGPYSRREGESIKSPTARFIQWKAVLTRAGSAPAARLTSVTVAYLPRNSRPTVSSITVHPPGVVFQRPFSSDDGAIAGLDDLTAETRRPPGDSGPPPPPPGRRMFQKGLQTLAWKAEDADGDRLIYSLQYRREGDQVWQNLRSSLTDSIFVWDTTTVADGRYVIRLTASDSPANGADRKLDGDRESDPISIDNTPPVIVTEISKNASGVRLVVRVRDAQNPIQKVEYSIGGGPWQLVFPADGLADSPEERYEIPLANESEAGRLVIRATDLLQNVTSQAVGR